MKASPVTGEQVPDENARRPVEQYVNPRKAAWPEADFIVGNPPFIGNKRMRTALGDGYVEALRGAWPEMPESADFVMVCSAKGFDKLLLSEELGPEDEPKCYGQEKMIGVFLRMLQEPSKGALGIRSRR